MVAVIAALPAAGPVWSRPTCARVGGETASAVLADCDASHEREAAYAAARGLTPSR